MSELSPIGTCNVDDNSRSGSVGPLLGSTRAKIMDEEGNSLPANTPGELALHGPQVMMGYLNQPDKTRECLSESGWLRTGDVAQYDEEGFVSNLPIVFIFGRLYHGSKSLFLTNSLQPSSCSFILRTV